jgi:toxin YoeB
MSSVTFQTEAWEEYLEWQETDKKIFKRINALIKDIQRSGPLNGIGKPEVLKHIQGYSRRIDEQHRLIYRIDEGQNLRIISCKGHYE